MPCFWDYGGTVSTPDMESCDGAETKKADSNFLRIVLEAMNMQVLLELLLDSTLTLIHANWGACQATSQSCYLNSTLTYDPITSLLSTCYQGSVPNYYVEVQQVSDVQKTMEFGTGTQYPLSRQEYRTRLQRPLFSTQQSRFMDV
jgi:hypothetical protein